jgi:predicted permease
MMFCFMLVYYVYKWCFKENTGAEAAIMALISGSSTIGFLGFAVLEPIFGTTPRVALVVAIVGIVVNAVGIPVGLSLLNASLEKTEQLPAGKKRPSAWQPVIHALMQPVAWAPILAVIWVIVGIPWPKWASPSFDLIKGANASLAVFAAGVALSAVKVTINWQAILGAIMKLVVMPALLLIVGLIFKMDPMNLKMLVVAGALPPAFSGVIIADEYDRYVATGTSSLALSVILFIAFCPFWIWFTDLCIKMY